MFKHLVLCFQIIFGILHAFIGFNKVVKIVKRDEDHLLTLLRDAEF